jgi:hypothetical protein
MDIEKKIPSPINKKIYRPLKRRAQRFELTDDLIVRLRLMLFLLALLTIFLAFQLGDDWYVREYANYDWARHIGFYISTLVGI